MGLGFSTAPPKSLNGETPGRPKRRLSAARQEISDARKVTFQQIGPMLLSWTTRDVGIATSRVLHGMSPGAAPMGTGKRLWPAGREAPPWAGAAPVLISRAKFYSAFEEGYLSPDGLTAGMDTSMEDLGGLAAVLARAPAPLALGRRVFDAFASFEDALGQSIEYRGWVRPSGGEIGVSGVTGVVSGEGGSVDGDEGVLEDGRDVDDGVEEDGEEEKYRRALDLVDAREVLAALCLLSRGSSEARLSALHSSMKVLAQTLEGRRSAGVGVSVALAMLWSVVTAARVLGLMAAPPSRREMVLLVADLFTTSGESSIVEEDGEGKRAGDGMLRKEVEEVGFLLREAEEDDNSDDWEDGEKMGLELCAPWQRSFPGLPALAHALQDMVVSAEGFVRWAEASPVPSEVFRFLGFLRSQTRLGPKQTRRRNTRVPDGGFFGTRGFSFRGLDGNTGGSGGVGALSLTSPSPSPPPSSSRRPGGSFFRPRRGSVSELMAADQINRSASGTPVPGDPRGSLPIRPPLDTRRLHHVARDADLQWLATDLPLSLEDLRALRRVVALFAGSSGSKLEQPHLKPTNSQPNNPSPTKASKAVAALQTAAPTSQRRGSIGIGIDTVLEYRVHQTAQAEQPSAANTKQLGDAGKKLKRAMTAAGLGGVSLEAMVGGGEEVEDGEAALDRVRPEEWAVAASDESAREQIRRSLAALDAEERRQGRRNVLDPEELGAFLGTALAAEGGVALPERLARALDVDGDGGVSFSEVVAGLALCARGSLGDKLQLLFAVLDEDGDGVLSAGELARAVERARARVERDHGVGAAHRLASEAAPGGGMLTQRVAALLDASGDGRTTRAEFTRALLARPSLARLIAAGVAPALASKDPAPSSMVPRICVQVWTTQAARHRARVDQLRTRVLSLDPRALHTAERALTGPEEGAADVARASLYPRAAADLAALRAELRVRGGRCDGALFERIGAAFWGLDDHGRRWIRRVHRVATASLTSDPSFTAGTSPAQKQHQSSFSNATSKPTSSRFPHSRRSAAASSTSATAKAPLLSSLLSWIASHLIDAPIADRAAWAHTVFAAPVDPSRPLPPPHATVLAVDTLLPLVEACRRNAGSQDTLVSDAPRDADGPGVLDTTLAGLTGPIDDAMTALIRRANSHGLIDQHRFVQAAVEAPRFLLLLGLICGARPFESASSLRTAGLQLARETAELARLRIELFRVGGLEASHAADEPAVELSTNTNTNPNPSPTVPPLHLSSSRSSRPHSSGSTHSSASTSSSTSSLNTTTSEVVELHPVPRRPQDDKDKDQTGYSRRPRIGRRLVLPDMGSGGTGLEFPTSGGARTGFLALSGRELSGYPKKPTDFDAAGFTPNRNPPASIRVGLSPRVVVAEPGPGSTSRRPPTWVALTPAWHAQAEADRRLAREREERMFAESSFGSGDGEEKKGAEEGEEVEKEVGQRGFEENLEGMDELRREAKRTLRRIATRRWARAHAQSELSSLQQRLRTALARTSEGANVEALTALRAAQRRASELLVETHEAAEAAAVAASEAAALVEATERRMGTFHSRSRETMLQRRRLSRRLQPSSLAEAQDHVRAIRSLYPHRGVARTRSVEDIRLLPQEERHAALTRRLVAAAREAKEQRQQRDAHDAATRGQGKSSAHDVTVAVRRALRGGDARSGREGITAEVSDDEDQDEALLDAVDAAHSADRLRDEIQGWNHYLKKQRSASPITQHRQSTPPPPPKSRKPSVLDTVATTKDLGITSWHSKGAMARSDSAVRRQQKLVTFNPTLQQAAKHSLRLH